MILGCVLVLLIGSVSTYYCMQEDRSINLEEKQYQGPVQMGYDLKHFRKTGETIKEVIG